MSYHDEVTSVSSIHDTKAPSEVIIDVVARKAFSKGADDVEDMIRLVSQLLRHTVLPNDFADDLNALSRELSSKLAMRLTYVRQGTSFVAGSEASVSLDQ